MIDSYFGNPVMFKVTRSFESVVVTLAPKSTVPPLPATQSEGSATVRTGLVTDDVGVIGVVGLVGVGVVGLVGVVALTGVVGADAGPVDICTLLKSAVIDSAAGPR